MVEPLDNAVIGAELQAGRLPSFVGVFIMVSVLVFIFVVFRPLSAAPWLIDIWVAAMAALVVALGRLLLRPATPVELNERLQRNLLLARRIQILMSWLIAASVWILLPPVDEGLRALMLMMYVWYIATVVASSNAAVPMLAREIVLITASIVGWVLWDQPPWWLAWAVFLAMAGLTMLSFSKLIRGGVVAATEARIASQAAEECSRAALAVAEAARDAKTRFIASATHDLQQPIHAASLYFDVALTLPDGEDRTSAIAGVHVAFESTQALLEEMLDHLRLENGAVRARLAPVSADRLLEQAEIKYGAAARAAGMTVRRVPTRLWVVADANLLHRSLGNIVANAIRHSRGEQLLLAARRRSAMAEFWVIDDGNGVAASDAQLLFDEFAQGSDATTAGFGLGLTSVRRQMALMGGEAAFEPRWRGGAAFVLRLPLTDAPLMALAAE